MKTNIILLFAMMTVSYAWIDRPGLLLRRAGSGRSSPDRDIRPATSSPPRDPNHSATRGGLNFGQRNAASNIISGHSFNQSPPPTSSSLSEGFRPPGRARTLPPTGMSQRREQSSRGLSVTRPRPRGRTSNTLRRSRTQSTAQPPRQDLAPQQTMSSASAISVLSDPGMTYTNNHPQLAPGHAIAQLNLGGPATQSINGNVAASTGQASNGGAIVAASGTHSVSATVSPGPNSLGCIGCIFPGDVPSPPLIHVAPGPPVSASFLNPNPAAGNAMIVAGLTGAGWSGASAKAVP